MNGSKNDQKLPKMQNLIFSQFFLSFFEPLYIYIYLIYIFEK